MDENRTVEINTQPATLSESDAKDKVGNQSLTRVKSLISDVTPVQAELRYKPFYAFDVTLTKRVFRGDNVVTEGRIIVDALADIARPFTKEAINETTEQVSKDRVISPQVTVDEATVTANSRRMQVEHRERKKVEMDESPKLTYKPVWIVELSNDDVRVVDAVKGTVHGDSLTG